MSRLHRVGAKSSDEGRLLRNSSDFRPQGLVTLNGFLNLGTPKLTESSKQNGAHLMKRDSQGREMSGWLWQIEGLLLSKTQSFPNCPRQHLNAICCFEGLTISGYFVKNTCRPLSE